MVFTAWAPDAATGEEWMVHGWYSLLSFFANATVAVSRNAGLLLHSPRHCGHINSKDRLILLGGGIDVGNCMMLSEKLRSGKPASSHRQLVGGISKDARIL